ncbi:MAG: acyltransferase [Bradyrhizobiaceae bacterium]|nr:MAG: acyltransferase [Bradyrhizobiaceae bacterium]
MTSNETYGTGVASASGRVDWVDYAKGICIIMVVMMHSTLGTELAAGRLGFMHHVVEFARPFRMPDFFLISGLFLPLVIDRDWRTYLDRKVVHFAYFYFLWVAIQFAFKAPGLAATNGWASVVTMYLESFIDPFGTLWFIYMLPIFFVVTKATRGRIPAAAIWFAAAALEMAHISTGWTVIDEFAARFVYFYSGYLFAPRVFAFAEWVRHHPLGALGALLIWALVNGTLVYADLATLPVISLMLGYAGACAIIATGTLLARRHLLDWLRYCGEYSITIYLAFFLPMAVTRILLLKSNLIASIGAVSLIVTVMAVFGALLIWWGTRNTRLKFLFERPDMFWIAPKKPRAVLQPAE